MQDIQIALKACDGIFVHGLADAKNLEAFKIRKNVHFLPTPRLKSQPGDFVNPQSCELVANHLLRKMAFAIATGV